MFLLSLVENGALWFHMPKAVKYSSQNQSGLFFPLDHDQVAGKGRIQKHRELPYCSFFSSRMKKKKKELGQEKFRKH